MSDRKFASVDGNCATPTVVESTSANVASAVGRSARLNVTPDAAGKIIGRTDMTAIGTSDMTGTIAVEKALGGRGQFLALFL
jgi:hypothetical protein